MQPSPRLLRWGMIVMVALASVLPFLGSLDSYFLSDDFGLIWLLWNKPLSHFLTLFAAPWTETIYGYRADEIRPTLAFSYWLDARWGAANPMGYHVSNIVLHALNALFVLAIGRRTLGLPWVWSGFAALLFAVMPVHAETVNWISGRADSIPSLLFLVAFFCFNYWRTNGGAGWYCGALLACFLALFSKQSAIVLPVVLVAYQALALGLPHMQSWRRMSAYLPFVALTAGYLALRLVLFGNAVREDSLGGGLVELFLRRQPAYVLATFTGVEVPWLTAGTLAVALGVALLLGALTWFAGMRQMVSSLLWRRLLFFGPLWWILTVGPLAVVGYFSARHLYLTSAGIALCAALIAAALWESRPGLARVAAGLGATTLAGGSFLLLQWATGQWNAAGRFSQAMAIDLQREAAVAPEGALLVVGAPPTGASPLMRTWLWGFSVPFALRPPFSTTDLTARVHIVTRPEVYCCSQQWPGHVAASAQRWQASTPSKPVIALGWRASDSGLLKRSDADLPSLRAEIGAMASMQAAGALTGAINALLTQLGEDQTRFRHE